MSDELVPAPLVDAILNGRCVAFVGAGFSAPKIPAWPQLLRAVGQHLGVPCDPGPQPSALELEALGQQLEGDDPTRLREAVHAVLRACEHTPVRAGGAAEVARRREALLRIPFKAILTTNFDDSLEGEPVTPESAWQVLREDARRWWHIRRQVPIVNLHGIASRGMEAGCELVFTRRSYRARLYDDANYANFIRSVFAEYTILFLGVSFTDAYLNELRSEILNVLHRPDQQTGAPWGYAVMTTSDAFAAFLRRHEGIEILRDDPAFTRFLPWLEALGSQTSVEGRLRDLLGSEGGKRIVWIDDGHHRNARGHALLERCGAKVIPLADARELDPTHAGVDLVITQYANGARAFPVLDTLRRWETRPPVIVFAADHPRAHENRAACLRRGAWEYTVDWSELYQCIDRLFGRKPGRA